ncbi:MAG: GWxTD domain-containing protein [Gemmatimonadota bacterium]
MNKRLYGFLFCLSLLLSRSAQGQDSVARADLEHFRDSIATISDSSVLITLESRMIDSAKRDRDSPLLHLRLGFLALRMGDIGSRGRYEDAGSEFEWAAELRPDWPYPWLGLGKAEAGSSDSTYGLKTRFKAMFGADPLTLAAEAMRRSTRVDSTFVPGLIALVSIVSRQRLNADPEEALRIVRRAAGTPAGQSPEFIFARASLERDIGSFDSAAAAYRFYLVRGGDAVNGRFELGRTLLAMGDAQGQELYYEAARKDDSVVAGRLRKDFALIAGDSGVGAFDSAGLAGREAFLQRFWTRRDRADLRKDGERLAEHYRRLFYAQRFFRRVPSKRRFRGFEDYHQSQNEFDARGEIYIRHGEPTERVEYPNFCSVSWRYGRADGDLKFHFLVQGEPGSQDFRLESSVLDICTPENLWLSPVFKWGPEYARLVNAGPNSMYRRTREQEWKGMDAIKEGVTTDRYELTFPRGLPAVAQILSVGRGDGGSLVHFTFAVRGDSLKPDTTDGVITYPLRIRILVTTPAGEVLTSTDVARHFQVNGPIPPGQFLTGREVLTIPPGLRAFRLAIQQGDSMGGVFPSGAIQVGRFGFGSDSLAISDLVLGSRSSGLTWNPTAEDTVYFNPLQTFREGSSLELYYEVYGLTAKSSYATQLSVRRNGRGRPEITLGFSELAGDDVTHGRRTIALDHLRAGDYTLEIEIKAADGHKVKQSRGFRVVKRN